MPSLDNPRYERFAQDIAKGMPVTEAAASADLSLDAFDKPAGFYVYLLIDPRSDSLFYVGKGKGARALAHAKEWERGEVINGRKFSRVGEILGAGHKIEIKVLCAGMTELDALRLERGIIHRIGFEKLTNVSKGSFTDSEKALAAAKFALLHIFPVFRSSPRCLGDITNQQRLEAYVEITGSLKAIVSKLEMELNPASLNV
jgi:hypothetical protein